MFNKQNFCHIASNNRNDVKAGVFVYKTTDDLQTVSASGYFNEKIVDINLHDLIIHEWHDPTDRTNVEYNLLCVTERTLDNVGTSPIMSDWEKGIEEIIADIDDKYVKKTGDTMTGALRFGNYGFISQMFGPDTGTGVQIGYNNGSAIPLVGIANITTKGIAPSNPNTNHTLGRQGYLWKSVYTKGINNGYDIAVPVTSAPETLALKSEVDLAANSGDQLTNKGVWYAKMYAATVAPAAEDGTNYADFSQVDTDNNPIIVIYERQNGAWVQTDTITPPADYNGYVTVTSKIWDIVEQSGQQGGKVLWSHNTKTFTPYPQIISFEDAALTGNSTVQMPQTPTGNSIVNVDYLSNHTGSGKNVGDVFFTMRTDSGLAGAVECNGATYNTTDFVGSGSIGGLLADGKIPYVSLATYQTLLNTQGSVGVFGWDGTGTTSFRVPLLQDIFVEAGTAAQIGDYIAPGLPDHSHTVSAARFANYSCDGGNNAPRIVNENQVITSTLASASNSIYGRSNTVQPKAVRYRAMVQLATGATDEALETCTNVLADVAGLKSHEVIEFQAPTADNNYTWYKKYADGSVEQGGQETHTTSAMGSGTTAIFATVTFPVALTKITGMSFADNMTFYNVHAKDETGTGMTIKVSNQLPVSGPSETKTIWWEVKGMAA